MNGGFTSSRNHDWAKHSPGDLGIVFLHHHINPVVNSNLHSIQKHHPEATLVTMSAGETLPGGYSLDSTPELKKLHAHQPNQSDWLLLSWFLQRKENCAKWWIVEWDVFCTTSAYEYYAPVWHFPFVASCVYRHQRESFWPWFGSVRSLPPAHRRAATGAVPFLYLLDESALVAICTHLINNTITGGNCELRFGTVGNLCGYSPCGFTPPNDHISWREMRPKLDVPAIFHPVKQLLD